MAYLGGSRFRSVVVEIGGLLLGRVWVMAGCCQFADRLLYWHEVVPTAGGSSNQS